MNNGLCVACGLCGVEEKCIQGFSKETVRKGTTWKTGVDGRIILEYFKIKIGCEVVEWIDVALVRGM